MKAKDLRIGNWVIGIKPFQLTINDFGRIDAHLTVRGEMRFDPIPLTEEWLVRFGFEEKKPETYHQMSCEMCNCDDYEFELHVSVHQESGCGVWIKRVEWGGADVIDMLISDRLHYCHQLQNLYHALTGKELELKTDSISK